MPEQAPSGLSQWADGNPFNKYKPGGAKPQAARELRKMLVTDTKMLTEDPQKLGLSDAEKEKMRAEAVQTATAQNQAQASQLATAALAGQGFQKGSFEAAQGQLGQAAADAGVKAGAQINDLSNRIAESKKADIMSRLEAEREKTKEKAHFWGGLGIAGVGAILQAAGLPGSPLMGIGSSIMGGGGGGGAPAAPTGTAGVDELDDLDLQNPAGMV